MKDRIRKISWIVLDVLALVTITVLFIQAREFRDREAYPSLVSNYEMIGNPAQYLYHFSMDEYTYDKNSLSIAGWIFREDVNSALVKSSIVLKPVDGDGYYYVHSYRMKRRDVTDAFINDYFEDEDVPRETAYDLSGVYTYTIGSDEMPLDGRKYQLLFLFEYDGSRYLVPSEYILEYNGE